MIIILDANIVFSSVLNPKSVIAGILFDSENGIIFIAPSFLKLEIYKHVPRICKLTGFDENRIHALIEFIFSKILFYPDEVIPDFILNQADEICAKVDPKDSIYIAFALFFESKVWSGDKKLIRGLRTMGMDLLIETFDVLQIIRSFK